MSDSCRARNDEPGFAATYSKPSDLMTSTMKSEPGRSVVYMSTRGGGGLVSDATWAGEGGGAARRFWTCAFAAGGFATSPAAPAAAPFRKRRRSTELLLDFAISFNLLC